MLFHIIKKELLNNLLTARVLVCYAAIFILVFTGVLLRGLQYNMEVRFFDAQKNREQLRTAEKQKDPESTSDAWLWNFGMQLNPRPLSVFCEGFHKQITEPFRINPQAMVYDTFNFEAPLARVFTVYNVAFITAMAVSLLCIFIGFDTFSSERESGTLRLMLSNPVSRATCILGKFAGGYLSVVWPVVTSFTASLLFCMLALRIRFTGPDLLRFALLIGVVLGYLSVWFLLSMLFSIIARRSSRSLFLTVMVWIFFAVAIPYGGHEISKRLVPVTTLAEVYKLRETEQLAAARARNRLTGRLRRENPPDFELREWRAYYDYFTAIHNSMVRIGAAWERSIKNQMGKGMTLSRVSPAAQFLNAAAGLAGTGFYDYWKSQDWKSGLYIRNKNSFEAERMRRREAYTGTSIMEREAFVSTPQAFDRSQLPSRIFRADPAGVAVYHVLPDILLLMLENIFLFTGAFYLFIRRRDI